MADYSTITDTGECVFCSIAAGHEDTPGIFWQNEEFMAFLAPLSQHGRCYRRNTQKTSDR